jgi:TonB family protein
MKRHLHLLLLIIVMLIPGCMTSQVATQPEVIFQARPQYPFEMRRAGIHGEVLVAFVVDIGGVPREVIAVNSSDKAFAPAAVAAVQKWRFKPGTVNGRAVNVRMVVPIIFTLSEEGSITRPQPMPAPVTSPGSQEPR